MRKVHPKLQRNHIGLDGFIWAVGVVEHRFDPLYLGRCKVRYFGWHTEDKDEMPTENLPWSYPIVDLDSGRNVVGPKEGDWVVGFFRDGIIAQEPVMIGVVPGIPEIEANPELGFNDPRPDSILEGHKVPREVLSFPKQHDDGTGQEFEELGIKSRFPQNEPADGLLRYVDQKESTASRFERNEFIDQTLVEIKKENIDIGQRDIPVAEHPSSEVGTDHESLGDPFTELETQYAALYPYNHAYYSESGHLIERDDTPGKERLHWFHRVGTFKEIHPQGTVVEKIVDDEYHIVLKSRYKHIEAMDIETVDWNKKLFVNKDEKDQYNYDITIGSGGDYNLTIRKGLYNKYIMDGDENTRIKHNRYYLIEDSEYGQIKKDKHILIEKDYTVHVFGYTNIVTHQNCTITALKNLNLNAKNNLNITCGGDLTIECAGRMMTKVAGNKWDVTTGDNYRLTIGSVFDLCSSIFTRVAASILDLSFGGFSHTTWSNGPVNLISPANVYLNGIIPAIPYVDPEIGPGPISPASGIYQALMKVVLEQVSSMLLEKSMNLSDFSTLSQSVIKGADGSDKVEPVELMLRDLTAKILELTVKEPVIKVDAPMDTTWTPVSMDGVATILFPFSVSPKDKTKLPECRLLSSTNNLIEAGEYVRSIEGSDLYKFSKSGLEYAINSEEHNVSIEYNGYKYEITEPAKKAVGNGKTPKKIQKA